MQASADTLKFDPRAAACLERVTASVLAMTYDELSRMERNVPAGEWFEFADPDFDVYWCLSEYASLSKRISVEIRVIPKGGEWTDVVASDFFERTRSGKTIRYSYWGGVIAAMAEFAIKFAVGVVVIVGVILLWVYLR